MILFLWTIITYERRESKELKSTKSEIKSILASIKNLESSISDLKEKQITQLSVHANLEKRFNDLEYEALKPKTLNIHASKPIPVLIGIRGVKSKQKAEDFVISQIKTKIGELSN